MTIEGMAFLFIITLFVIFMVCAAKEINKMIIIKLMNEKGKIENIGEFKSEIFDFEKKCWIFRFKLPSYRSYIMLSDHSISEYINIHLKKREYQCIYLIYAKVEKLRVDPYENELGWSAKSLLYKTICFICYPSGTGIPCSMIIFGTMFSLLFLDLRYFLFVGFAVGIFFCVANYFVSKMKRMSDLLTKKKKETLDYVLFMKPINTINEMIEYNKNKSI